PPFPVDVGLFGKPTLVNNVETLFSVLEIVLEGGAAFATMGTKESTGTRLFCVSGHVQRRGVYEVQMGTTLRELLELAGPTRKTQAVLLGGAAGSFVMPGQFDLRPRSDRRESDRFRSHATEGPQCLRLFSWACPRSWLASPSTAARSMSPRARPSSMRAGVSASTRRRSASWTT